MSECTKHKEDGFKLYCTICRASKYTEIESELSALKADNAELRGPLEKCVEDTLQMDGTMPHATWLEALEALDKARGGK